MSWKMGLENWESQEIVREFYWLHLNGVLDINFVHEN